MKNKILPLVLALLTLAAPSHASFSDVPADAVYAESVDRLAALGILAGTGGAAFSPNAPLTRAQFAKLAVHALGREDSATSGGGAAVFTDITPAYWASGYINYVSANNIISGYPDGRFGPEENITYAQAVTVLIRMLGYTAADVGHHWPQSYIEKAAALGVTRDLLIADYSEPVPRGWASLLLDRTLLAKASDGKYLAQNMGLAVYENCIMYATQETDASLEYDEMLTTAGTFKTASLLDKMKTYLGYTGTLLVDGDGVINAFVPGGQTKRSVIVKSFFVDSGATYGTLSCTENGAAKTISLAANATVYYQGSKSSAQALTASMTEGSEMALFSKKDGSFDYAVLFGYSMEGPFTVTSDYNQLVTLFSGIRLDTVKIVRKGLSASPGDIKRFDVVYYAATTNTVYAYADRVTGTYDKASPIKANVTAVTLSGSEYPLATQKAINKLNESEGAFTIGDRVTLLFGKNGEVVDAVNLDASDIENYCVVLGSDGKISSDPDTEGRLEYFTRVITGGGQTMEYKTDKDYTAHKGEFRKMSFSGGVATLSRVAATGASGAIDRELNAFAGYFFAPDYTVIELVDNAEGTGDDAIARKITLNDISYNSLTPSQVLHVQFVGGMKDIGVLYLKDVSGSRYTYGIVANAERSGNTIKSLTVLSGGTKKTFSGTYVKSVADGAGIGFIANGNALSEYLPLEEVSKGEIQAYTTDRVKVKSAVYRMADDVGVYYGSMSAGFKAVAISDITSLSYTSATLYADRPVGSGGKVRVIVLSP